MNKMVSKFALAASLSFAMVFMISCTSDDSSAFVGKWKDDDSTEWELFKDGTAVENKNGISISWKWKIVENKRFVATVLGFSLTFDYEISGNTFTLTDDKGKSEVWVKVQEGENLKGKRDYGKKYKTVKIGYRTWMAENLNLEVGVSRCYNNNPDNCEKYGRLYNWTTAMEACPSGWHLPSKAEWDEILNWVGGTKVAGAKLKASSGWNGYNGVSGNGTDEFGFSALPGGGYSGGNFDDVGYFGYWWSASQYYNSYSGFGGSDAAYALRMDYNNEGTDGVVNYKNRLFSVRCLQDYEISKENRKEWEKKEKEIVSKKPENNFDGSTFTDSRDDKTYKIAKIGTQTWMAENLSYATGSSKCYGNEPANCKTYGRLYNWAEAKNSCPSGWHLPNDNEWVTLANYAGSGVGKKLKSKNYWNSNSTDEYGFSALPGGSGKSDGSFIMLGKYGYWWSIGEETSAYYRYVSSEDDNLSRLSSAKTGFFSIRCVKD
jgi:uncharacterized protein (TIGR02145 family)